MSWCIQRDQRKIAGAGFVARAWRGDIKNRKKIHVLKGSWQSNLNLDMKVYFSYLLLKIFENHERIASGIDWFWGRETGVTGFILVYHARFSSQNILGIF